MSMAAVALACGINANLLRRWVREAEVPAVKLLAKAAPTFVPLRLPEASTPVGEVRIEVRRGTTTITVAWPMAAAAECASWMRELLR